MMKIIKFIFLSLISLFFLSCESVYLDLNNVHCNLNKATYVKEENIILNYYGSFEDSNDIGNLRIDFLVFKLINGERDEENLADIKFSATGNPENILSFSKGSYYVYIKENDKMTSFNNSIIFSIKESGEYELVVGIRGCTKKHPYEDVQIFTLPITITE